MSVAPLRRGPGPLSIWRPRDPLSIPAPFVLSSLGAEPEPFSPLRSTPGSRSPGASPRCSQHWDWMRSSCWLRQKRGTERAPPGNPGEATYLAKEPAVPTTRGRGAIASTLGPIGSPRAVPLPTSSLGWTPSKKLRKLMGNHVDLP